MNLLELTKKQVLIISAVTVVAGLAGMVSLYAYAAGNPAIDYKYKATQTADVEYNGLPSTAVSETQAEDKPQESQPPVETTSRPTTPKQTAQAAPAQPAAPEKTEPLNGGHIPFTNLPVIPGDPLSYVGTVGQCPFYEMAGDKGCYPPSDIICNADWTICGPR